MRRTTALLTVMLVAGTPGASLACELWCNTPAAESHRSAVGCHHTPDAGQGEQVTATAGECHEAPAVAAFLKESRPPDTHTVTIASAVDTPAAVFRRDVEHEGWCVFSGRSVRPPALHTVLRI
jgi:hypothetical protein